MQLEEDIGQKKLAYAPKKIIEKIPHFVHYQFSENKPWIPPAATPLWLRSLPKISQAHLCIQGWVQ